MTHEVPYRSSCHCPAERLARCGSEAEQRTCLVKQHTQRHPTTLPAVPQPCAPTLPAVPHPCASPHPDTAEKVVTTFETSSNSTNPGKESTSDSNSGRQACGRPARMAASGVERTCGKGRLEGGSGTNPTAPE